MNANAILPGRAIGPAMVLVMLILNREIGQSILIEDVQLRLIQADARSLVFSMEKLSGGRETKVRMQRHQIVNICYDVRIQMISMELQTARLVLEHPDSVTVKTLD